MQRGLPRAFLALCLSLATVVLTAADATGSRSHSPLLNAKGQLIDPFANKHVKLLAFIFVTPDCPVSNSYAPEVQRLHAAFAQRGVDFWLVYPDPDISESTIHEHLKAYGYPCEALRDSDCSFAKRARVEVTPEAALFSPDGTLLYSGRIDNRYAGFGAKRPKATEHDLSQAIEDALAGNPVKPAGGPPVGCFIEGAK